jgi:hypothetical protein
MGSHVVETALDVGLAAELPAGGVLLLEPAEPS